MNMKCKLITETINGRTFIGGYYSDPQGIELPDKIANVQWRDEYGNYKWELLADRAIAPANLAPTAEQLVDAQDRAFAEKVAPIFFKLLKQAVKTTSTPAESWKAIDSAIREQMNGG